MTSVMQLKRGITLALGIALSLALGGCFADDFDESSKGSEGDDVGDSDDGDRDRDDCKIEGSAIGAEGVRVTLGDLVITVSDWIPKADSPGEYVGFTVSASDGGSLSYVVKAGTERWHSTDASWSNPLGVQGPDVKGISNVDFCDCEEDNGDECDYDPGDDPDCNDPDGCDNDPNDCTDPDGCDNDPDGGDECVSDDECATGEFCEDGFCLPVVL